MPLLDFQIQYTEKLARQAKLTLNKIQIETPIFMPVGTRGTVKAISQEHLEEIGYQLILGNTYHLYLRPGQEQLKELGGLKKFMSWSQALLTDSGGYQAFSLSSLTKYKPEGVQFKSHLDGSMHLFSPELVLDIQNAIGSDIVMPIDDCAPYPASAERLRQSLKRTHQWISESKKIWLNKNYAHHQNLFGIAQGGIDTKLRKESAQYMASLDLPGYSIGGLSVGEKGDDFRTALATSCENLPINKPRYLMGVGSIPEIIHAVSLGVDMFDCVLPTRNARNGQVFTSIGKINVRNEKWKKVERPLDPKCNCRVCQKYSIGYIRHLHHCKEILGIMLTTYHNLYFMYSFMKDLRFAIKEKKFHVIANEYMEKFKK